MKELAFLEQGRIAHQQILEDGSLFPMVLLPPDENPSIGSFVDSIQHNKEWIDNQLKQAGALLFKGFPLRTASDFNAVVEAFGWEEYPYLGLASRNRIEGRVYTANEAPLDQPIKFHHEMAMVTQSSPFHITVSCYSFWLFKLILGIFFTVSCSSFWLFKLIFGIYNFLLCSHYFWYLFFSVHFDEFPTKVIFFCEIAPPEGGQTSIVLSHKITQRMEQRYPQLVKKLEEVGLIYPCSIPQEDDSQSFLKGWQSRYETNNKKEAEKKLVMSGVPVSKITWADDGTMLFEMGPVVSIRTFEGDTYQRKAWFNPSTTGLENPTPILGDGSLFPEEAIEPCIQITEEECVDITWEVGDVLVLDNRFVQHARRPSTPPRRVLAAFCK